MANNSHPLHPVQVAKDLPHECIVYIAAEQLVKHSQAVVTVFPQFVLNHWALSATAGFVGFWGLSKGVRYVSHVVDARRHKPTARLVEHLANYNRPR
jgi:hypothetical protein